MKTAIIINYVTTMTPSANPHAFVLLTADSKQSRHREVKRYSLHKAKAYTRSPLFMVLTKAVHLWIG
ncbi:hypothetical protein Hdeb2414_s0004g00148611 [Helianthus debilis subsp. tardiflorus]